MPRNTVALGVHVPVMQPGGGVAFDPVRTMEGFARIQNELNQNRLFQQSFAARQRFGEIVAQAPDIETGYNMALKDPLAAPFAVQQLNEYRQGMLAQRQYNESLGRDARTGLEAVMKAAPQAFIDPAGYEKTMKAYFSTIPKDAQGQAVTGFNLVHSALFDGLEGMNADQQRREIQKRSIGLGIGSGALSADTVHSLWGFPAAGETSIPDPAGGPDIPGVRTAPIGGEAPSFLPYGTLPTGPAPGGVLPVAPTTGPRSEAVPTPAPADTGAVLTQTASADVPTGGEDQVLPSPGDYVAPASTAMPAADTSGAGPSQLVTPTQAAAAGRGGGEAQIAQAGDQRPYAHGLSFQQEQDIRLGSEQAKAISEDIDSDARSLPGVANRLNALQDALKDFPAGGWASSRANIAQWIQGAGHALGINPAQVDEWSRNIVGGKMEAQQVFHSLINQYAIESLKNVAQGTGRVMKSEVEQFLNAISENTDPRAIETLLNTQGRRILQINADRINKFIPYRNAIESGQLRGYKPQDFFKWYATNSNINELPTTFQGIPIGPRDPMEAKTVPEMSGPGHYWNPSTNSFSPTAPTAPATGGP